jgi:hypothetical protein
MRKLFNVFFGFFSAIILLLSIVFIVIEGRLLFCGDWIVYDNVALGFFKYFFRFLIAIFAATHSIFEYINMKKKNQKITHYLFVGNIAFLIVGITLFFTASNYVGEIALLLSLISIIIKLMSIIVMEINVMNKNKK